VRVRLKGINSKTRRLADGRIVTYWWAWKGGPRLQGEPGSPEFIASYNEAVGRRVALPAGVLLTVLIKYQGSEAFLQLAERTRRDYAIQIKLIEREFGDLPIEAIADRRNRGIFMKWRDKLVVTSRRQVDYARAVLARILAWGLDSRSFRRTRASAAVCCTALRASTR
jgi:hypothetical protein